MERAARTPAVHLCEPRGLNPLRGPTAATATSSRHVACGGPSPPTDAPRVRQPSARGNPPAAGPPLRSGPSEQARLGATGGRLPRGGAWRRGNGSPPDSEGV